MVSALTIVAVLLGILLAYVIWIHITLANEFAHLKDREYETRRRLKRLDDIILPHNFDIDYTKRLGPAFRKTRSLVHTRHKEYTLEIARLSARLDVLETKK